MAVPDTNTFSLQDVINEVNPSTNDLVSCFADAYSVGFDPAYEEDKNELNDFRNYVSPDLDLFLYLKLNNNTTDSSVYVRDTYTQAAFTYDDGLYSGAANESVIFSSNDKIITVDATDNYFSFGDGSTDSDFTIGLVIKPSSDGVTRTLASKGDFRNNTNKEYRLWLDSSNLLNFAVYDESAGGKKHIKSTSTFLSSNIYNLDATYISGVLKVYSNGSELTTTDESSGSYTAMETFSNRLQFGKEISFNHNPYAGNMDEINIWRIGLTSSQVSSKNSTIQSGDDLI